MSTSEESTTDGERDAEAREARGRRTRARGDVSLTPLIEGKLHPPTQPAGIVPRTRLLRLLDAEPAPPIVTVTAPAGYGKTALLADWTGRETRPSAWLTIDALDNDPSVLVAYLAVAIDRLDPGGLGASEAVRASGTRILAAAVPHLATALHRLRRPASLVIDDVHRLTDQAALDALDALLDHLSPAVHVALAGRSMAALPLGRRRVQGRLLEIQRKDLALDVREIAEVMTRAGRRPSASATQAILERTEGWPAAVHLASADPQALDARTAPAAPGGDPVPMDADGHLAAYIRSEMLSTLSEDDAILLTRTSILELVEPAVAEAVAGLPDAGKRLRGLAAADQLISRVEGTRATYRYHALLRECLEDELDRREPGSEADLHRRAMEWYADAGRTDLAIEHAFRAGAADDAADLVASAAIATLYGGHGDSLERWVGSFDAQTFERNPSLATIGAWVHLLGGRPDAASDLAAVAGRTVARGRPRDGSASYASARAILRAAMVAEDPSQVLRDATFAIGEERRGSAWRPLALTLAGSGHQMLGDDAAADAAFAEAADEGALPGRMLALACRAGLAAARRDWSAADRFAAESRGVLERARLGTIVTSLKTHAISARLLIRRGDVIRGREALVRAQIVRPLASRAAPWVAVNGLLDLARAYLALSDHAGAETVIGEAEAIVRLGPPVGVLADELADLRTQVGRASLTMGGSSTLTAAELRILPMLPTHLSFSEIGDRLHLSRHTIKSEALSIYRKLGASSRSEAVEVAVDLGLLEPFPGYGLGQGDRAG